MSKRDAIVKAIQSQDFLNMDESCLLVQLKRPQDFPNMPEFYWTTEEPNEIDTSVVKMIATNLQIKELYSKYHNNLIEVGNKLCQ